jgi:hypothetical protein
MKITIRESDDIHNTLEEEADIISDWVEFSHFRADERLLWLPRIAQLPVLI